MGWTERCESAEVRRFIKGFPLLGERYPRAIQSARINLALMNGPVVGASSADLTTSRTYTIPATGGFMLHERNPEILKIYKEHEEIACFDCVEELAETIDYYLMHPVERSKGLRLLATHGACRPIPMTIAWLKCFGGTPSIRLADIAQMAPAEVEAS